MPKQEGIEYIQLLRASARDVKKTGKKRETVEEKKLAAAVNMFKNL